MQDGIIQIYDLWKLVYSIVGERFGNLISEQINTIAISVKIKEGPILLIIWLRRNIHSL